VATRSEANATLSAFSRPAVPIAYERLMLAILEERGFGAAESLLAAGIDPADVERPGARVTLEQCVRLVLHALRVTGDAGLGYEFGLRLTPSVHGVLGFAAMTGGTLGDALSVASKYIRARLPHFRLIVERDGDTAVVELRETFPIPVLREFFFECVLVGFARTGVLICEHAPDMEIWFEWPEQGYHARYRSRLPPISFERPANQIRFPARSLDARLLFSNEHAHRDALARVEHEEWVGSDDVEFVTQARAALRSTAMAYASSVSLAKRLGVSERTLRRKLLSQGTSYRQMLDEARYRDARQLLESTNLDLAEISGRLGFESPPAFTRAFKQWAKTTPSDYRADHRNRR
jgi:AraC-like DNA-binding protein